MENPLCPFKRTDFRYVAWREERKQLRIKAKKNRFRVEVGPQPKNKSAISIDTSKAKSTVDVVRLCLRDLGWREYPMGKRDGGLCDFYWNSVHFNEVTDLIAGKVNKFPGMVETVRKVNLGRVLDIMQKLYPEEYNFHPRSWFLPQQFAEFCEEVRLANEKRRKPMYIIKPDEGSQGEGIYLLSDPKDYIFNNKRHVAQEYIANPLLLESLKFDFRVYVVLASLEPLEIYISKEGLTRFCTVPYQPPTNRNITDVYMHLTNYSLNKHSINYLHTESDEDGSKRTTSSVFKQLDRLGYDVQRIWSDIEKVVAKTIIGIAPELKVEYRAELPTYKSAANMGISCFQILGFDIILDESGKPYLLEVNANPSLRIDFEHEIAPGIPEYIHSPVDEEIKRPLVMDTLLLVAPRIRSAARMLHETPVEIKSAPAVRRNVVPPAPEDDQYECARPPHKGFGTLSQVYPRKYGTDLDPLRILDRAADIFLDCIGVRGALRMGSTGFRTFARKCRLTSSGTGLTNAALDIMFIDLQRRWEHVNPDRTSGLCFQGFIEAFFIIAKKKFPANSLLECVENMLDYSEANIEFGSDKLTLPKLTKSEKRMDEIKSAYGTNLRKSLGNNLYIDYTKLPQEERPRPIRIKSYHLLNKPLQQNSEY